MNQIEDRGADGSGTGVRVLARGLAILQAFEPDNAWRSNTELAARTGVPKPTVSRITAHLTASGYLIYSPEKAQYKLGTSVLALGYLAASACELTTQARPLMQQLADDHSGSIVLASQDGLRMVCREVCHGRGMLFGLRVHPGSRLSLSRSALGRAVIGAMNETERAKLLAAIAHAHPEHWERLEPEIQAAVRQMQAHDYCIAIGTVETGTNGIAVVIDMPDRPHAYALGFAVPANQVTAEHLAAAIAPRLLEIKHRLERDVARRSPE